MQVAPSIKGVEYQRMQRHSITIKLDLPQQAVAHTEEYQDELMVLLQPEVSYAVCPECSKVTGSPHDWWRQKVRDLPIMDKKVYLIATKRRFKCHSCQVVFMESLEWLRPYARMTKRYEQYLYKKMNSSTVVDCCSKENIGYSQALGIFKKSAAIELEEHRKDKVTSLGIDEFARKKQRKYDMIVTDPVNRRVLEVMPDRNRGTLEEYLKGLEDKKDIKSVSIDMWRPYKNAVKKILPEATIVIDKFHVIKVASDALDSHRRQLQRDKERKKKLKGGRFLLLRNLEDFDEEKRDKLSIYLQDNPDLGLGYYLKEELRSLYRVTDRDYARDLFRRWCLLADHSGIRQFTETAATFKRWEEYILNYFTFQVTNAFTEGSNNKIKLIKRRGYGYSNFSNFRQRILTECAA